MDQQSERRAPDKSFDQDVQGFLARAVKARKSIVDLNLREGDDEGRFLQAARAEFARIGGLVLLNPSAGLPDNPTVEPAALEQMDLDHLMALATALAKLPDPQRIVGNLIRSPQEIMEAIPDLPAFLNEMRRLDTPVLWEMNEKGQMVMGDGALKAPDHTRSKSYNLSRAEATRLVYRDREGVIRVWTGDDFERQENGNIVLPIHNIHQKIIQVESILMERALPTLVEGRPYYPPTGEYPRFNSSEKFERKKIYGHESHIPSIFTEQGLHPKGGVRAYGWQPNPERTRPPLGMVAKQESFSSANHYSSEVGSRRVVRVNLQFDRAEARGAIDQLFQSQQCAT
jgi:hypothetical protein